MTARPPSPPPDSRWSSIRPFAPRLLLKIREITSVSVTITLSTSFDTSYLNPINHVGSDLDGEDGVIEALAGVELSSKQGIADVLKGGLVVKLNGSPWQKVVIHTEDADEEAIIVLYGLFPARHYEVELSVVAGEESYHTNFVANTDDVGEEADDSESDVHPVPSIPPPIQTATPEATPPSSPREPPSPAPPALLTVEERLAQLRHVLNATISERDSYTNQLKTARKDAQRADAALKAEVETLKRAAEKNAAADLRSRQKLLALQETVKRLHASVEEADQQTQEMEKLLPQLEQQARDVEEEHAKVKEEAEKSELETDEALKADKKRTADLDADMSALNNRLEKLNTKKDKFLKDVLPDYEEQLAAIAKEFEALEHESPPAVVPLDFDHETHYPHHYHTPQTIPSYNARVSIGTSRPTPIQRPVQNSTFTPLNQPPPNVAEGSTTLITPPHNSNNNFFHSRNPSIPPHGSARGSAAPNTVFPRPQPGIRPVIPPSQGSQETTSRSGMVAEAPVSPSALLYATQAGVRSSQPFPSGPPTPPRAITKQSVEPATSAPVTILKHSP